MALGLLSVVLHLPTSVTFILPLITFGIPLSIFDIRQRRLPNVLTGALFLSSIGIAVTNSLLRHESHRLVLGLGGAASMIAFYFMISLLSRGGLGMGDVKLAFPLGFISGFFGIRAVWISNFFAISIGALFSIVLLLFARAGVKSTIPFGPFMLFGQLLCLLLLTP